MLLLDDIPKGLRPVFPCEHQIGHNRYLFMTTGITIAHVSCFFSAASMKIDGKAIPGRSVNGGERGIRTLGTAFGSTHDFQSCSFSQLGHLSVSL
jgi:hypothetical protein